MPIWCNDPEIGDLCTKLTFDKFFDLRVWTELLKWWWGDLSWPTRIQRQWKRQGYSYMQWQRQAQWKLKIKPKKKIKIAEKKPFCSGIAQSPPARKVGSFFTVNFKLLLVLKSIWTDFFSVLLVFFQILPWNITCTLLLHPVHSSRCHIWGGHPGRRCLLWFDHQGCLVSALLSNLSRLHTKGNYFERWNS